jgi:predicted alpha/beta-hydrolase family hydrolase
VHLHPVDSLVAALVLGHGAGGGTESPDLVGATRAAGSAGLSVGLVEQPYRVAGRRRPAPASQLDAAWAAVVSQLREGLFSGLPILTGGRSLGARVACRTAAATDSVAVLCLAFPLHPPGRPEKSRLPELDAVKVPTLVVQGESDPFGTPPDSPNRTLARIPGTTRSRTRPPLQRPSRNGSRRSAAISSNGPKRSTGSGAPAESLTAASPCEQDDSTRRMTDM